MVNVFDFGMEAGDPFIVMELIDGGDLGLLISEQAFLQPLAAAKIAQQIFEALDAAHARGIIHRDIKPTNVLLTSARRAKVADFGIARAFSEAQLTMPGTTLGSVHYFSPEQARGEMVTTCVGRLFGRPRAVRDAHRPSCVDRRLSRRRRRGAADRRSRLCHRRSARASRSYWTRR